MVLGKPTEQSDNGTVKSDDAWTVRRVIDWTTAYLAQHGSETPRLDSEVLLAHARDCERIELYTRFHEVLSDEERRAMRDLVRRRAQAEPVAYLVGHREFFGLDFQVTPDVLIPRPDTETLVMELLELAKGRSAARILDVGTGSGCIAVVVAVQNPRARLTAIDISKRALAVARENAKRHAVSDHIRFLQGDLFSPLKTGEQFDFIAANPPYVTEAEMETLQADVRLHEPHLALAAGSDGLAVLRRLIEQAPRHLNPGGRLLLEITPERAADLCDLLRSQETYAGIDVIEDLAGKSRLLRAQKVA